MEPVGEWYSSFVVSCLDTSCHLSPASAPSMETSATAVESSCKPSSPEATKAGASSEGAGPRKPAMIEPAEGAGTCATRVGIAAVKIGGTSEARRMKVIAIDDRPAVRD